jgi:hypothetical protein
MRGGLIIILISVCSNAFCQALQPAAIVSHKAKISDALSKKIVIIDDRPFAWEAAGNDIFLYDLAADEKEPIVVSIRGVFGKTDQRWTTELYSFGGRLFIVKGNLIAACKPGEGGDAALIYDTGSHYDEYRFGENAVWCYTYSQKASPEPHNAMRIDASGTRTFLKCTQEFPNARTIEPNDHFDVSGDRAAAADVFRFRILIYENGLAVDSIVGDTIADFGEPLNSSDIGRLKTKVYSLTDISELNQQLLGRKSRVWNVFYLNDSTIFVRTSQPVSGAAGFGFTDYLWKKSGSWRITAKVLHSDLQNGKLRKTPFREFSWPFFTGYSTLAKNGGKMEFSSGRTQRPAKKARLASCMILTGRWQTSD